MTSDAISYKLPHGIGVFSPVPGGEILVYEVDGTEVLWCRPLGRECLQLTPGLVAAVWADRGKA